MPKPSLFTFSSTSLSLLERVRGQDQEAWHRLLHIYGPLVISWIKYSGVDETNAVDVAQEVWQSVASSLAMFHKNADSGTFRGWLWTITRNKLNDRYRSQRYRPQAIGGTDAQTMFQSLPEVEPGEASGIHDNQILHRALELIRPDFDERNWQAFWRMVVDGQAAPAIGQELGMTANAVHQAKFRILRRLREEMNGLMQT